MEISGHGSNCLDNSGGNNWMEKRTRGKGEFDRLKRKNGRKMEIEWFRDGKTTLKETIFLLW